MEHLVSCTITAHGNDQLVSFLSSLESQLGGMGRVYRACPISAAITFNDRAQSSRFAPRPAEISIRIEDKLDFMFRHTTNPLLLYEINNGFSALQW